MNYWNVQIENPSNLYQELVKLKPTKETYNWVKNELRKHWKDEIKLSPLQLASCYYFNHNLSYWLGFLGWMSSVYANEEMYQRLLERVKNFNVQNIKIECTSFEKVMSKFKNDFFYCDPQYYLGKDSTLFNGLYPKRNFTVHHNNFNHEFLKELLLDHNG